MKKFHTRCTWQKLYQYKYQPNGECSPKRFDSEVVPSFFSLCQPPYQEKQIARSTYFPLVLYPRGWPMISCTTVASRQTRALNITTVEDHEKTPNAFTEAIAYVTRQFAPLTVSPLTTVPTQQTQLPILGFVPSTTIFFHAQVGGKNFVLHFHEHYYRSLLVSISATRCPIATATTAGLNWGPGSFRVGVL